MRLYYLSTKSLTIFIVFSVTIVKVAVIYNGLVYLK